MSDAVRVFTGYSYRTSSRFGSLVEITVADDVVTVTGVRAPRWVRDAWIGAQAGLMGAIVGAFVDWIFGARGAGRRLLRLLFWEWVVASLGALFLWWPSERGPNGLLHGRSPESRAEGTEMARRRYSSWSFRTADLVSVKRSRLYAVRGLWAVAWPWQLTMFAFPDRHNEVVFQVRVADEPPREVVVFAVAFDTPEMADEFVALLTPAEAPSS